MKYTPVDYKQILSFVEKPGRYINHELNASYSSVNADKVNFCLAFPDVYEVGISHLGIKILYSILNRETDASADRVYAPWMDCVQLMKQHKIPLFALESKIAVKDFDVLGFTLQTEQNFTNILLMLELSGIPFYADQRDHSYPLIIGGGINAVNPEPLAPFFDAILIGEGEEAIIEFKDTIKNNRHLQKEELLLKIAQIDGFYVPSLYQEIQNKVLPLNPNIPSVINIRKYSSFSNSHQTHNPQLVPWLEGTHNRYVAEIMRGCTRGCRFCQAGMFYRPTREREPELVINDILEGIRKNGWDEAGLLSLSSSDYTCIKPLLSELFNTLKSEGVSLALPSLRIDSIDDSLINLLNQIRKTGLTLAPEAGTQRLRDVINKNINEEDIFQAVDFAKNNGFRIIKFYFMVGLPFETEEDIDGIVDLIERVILYTNKKMALNVTISPFVPKPFTPFQWSAMDTKEELLRKVLKIKFQLQKYRMVKTKYHTIENSLMESVFCKLGRDAAKLLVQAYQNGAVFDGWNEFFKYEIWEKSASEIGFDLEIYRKEFDLKSVLPWDHINIDISKDFLVTEYQKSQNAILTSDCRFNDCTACGACVNTQPYFSKWNLENEVSAFEKPKIQYAQSYLYRIYYSKKDYLQFITHLDFLRMIHRLLSSARLPICYTQGFNPHPKTSYCPPLAIGIESENDFFDISLYESPDPKTVIEKLNSYHVKGLNFHFCIVLPDDKTNNSSNQLISSNEDSEWHQFYLKNGIVPHVAFDQEILDISIGKDISEALSQYNAMDSCFMEKQKKGGLKQFDLKTLIHSIEFKNKVLTVHKDIIGLNIYDILDKIFSIPRNEAGVYRIVRKKILSALKNR